MKDQQGNNSYKWNIGIDFGTSYNFVYGWKKDKGFENFSKKDDGKPIKALYGRQGGIDGIPSAYAVDDNGDIKGIGDTYLKKYDASSLKDIKSMIRKDEIAYSSAEENELKLINRKHAIQFFEWLFTVLNNFPEVSEIENIIVGMPCDTDINNLNKSNLDKNTLVTEQIKYTRLLPGIIAEALDHKKNSSKKLSTAEIESKIKCMDEPTLAGYAYFTATDKKDFQQLLVIDGGGGTIDIAHMVKDSNGFRCVLSDGGIGPSGTTVSDLLSKYIVEKTKLTLSVDEINKYKEDLFSSVEGVTIPYDDKIILLQLERNKNVANAKEFCEKQKRKQREDEFSVEYLKTNGNYKDSDSSDIIINSVVYSDYLLESIYQDKKDDIEKGNIKLDNVIFIGGMSRMADFRERVVDSLKKYFGDNISKNVIFPEGIDSDEHVKGTHPIGGITLTSSNIVALGACIAASNKYFAIESKNDIYVGAYDADETSYDVHMLGDVYICFEKNGQKPVEFPLFSMDKTQTESESVVLIQNLANYKTDESGEDVIWEKTDKNQKLLKFKIIVKSKDNNNENVEIKSFPSGDGILAFSKTDESGNVSICSDNTAQDERYFMIKLNQSEDCSLLLSLSNFVLNIYALPVKDIMAFSSEKSKDTKNLSIASCCII